MKLKFFLMFNAFVFGISAISAFAFTEKVLLMYGIESNSASSLLMLFAATGSLSIALITWLMRNVEDKKTQRAIILAYFITNMVGVLISISGIVLGVMKNGWLGVGFHLLIALGFAYFLFFKRSGA